MKFSIGDIVLLKRTGEEGRVVAFLNDEMLEVEVARTHFTVFIVEVEHPYLKWFTENKKTKPPVSASIEMLPVEEKQKGQLQVPKGFHFCFFPVYKFDEFEDVVDKIKIYFINQMPYQLHLQYECSLHSGSIFTHKTEVGPFSHFYLHDISFEHMHEQPRFCSILTQTGNRDRGKYLSETLRIKPKKLFEYISYAQKENNPMFHIKLADDFPPQYRDEEKRIDKVDLKNIRKGLVQQELKQNNKKTKSNISRSAMREIDLHIEKLVDEVKGLSNFEMLSIQLDAFERALYAAIEQQQLSLIVIHGVGKGRLKEEIHEILKSVPEIAFFQQGWNPRYGYGATEIFFNQ